MCQAFRPLESKVGRHGCVRISGYEFCESNLVNIQIPADVIPTPTQIKHSRTNRPTITFLQQPFAQSKQHINVSLRPFPNAWKPHVMQQWSIATSKPFVDSHKAVYVLSTRSVAMYQQSYENAGTSAHVSRTRLGGALRVHEDCNSIILAMEEYSSVIVLRVIPILRRHDGVYRCKHELLMSRYHHTHIHPPRVVQLSCEEYVLASVHK